ncbi:MAG: phosphopantothenoylcysteine decarboxylase [Chitinophagales bacterium]|nr:phosphopantothenoylcysteine decarboxylase [Chitinophagales bacterium]MDW8274689.1 phosphopantothenoylcysteine decarboxylase [Chitinophagales bacterium]
MKATKVLITAGPTREAIDPVRYISNHSTGKMGIALADAFAAKGCEVHLVLGPTELRPQNKMDIYSVISAADMYARCSELYPDTDIAVFAAAVADYTPRSTSELKIKKQESHWILDLVKTKDIAYELGKLKQKGQVNIIFALETDNEKDNAREKLQKKNADFVVLNSLRDEGAGFGTDTNKISIIFENGSIRNFDLQSKQSLAVEIVNEALRCLKEKNEKT